MVLACLLTPVVRADDASARSLLVQAILSNNVKEQVELIGKLETVESDVVPAVLNAWRDGAVFIHEGIDGQKIPFLRADNKAIRIDDGNPIEAAETTPVETTTKLRRTMKSALDVLSIAGIDPQARRAAVTKLGMTQNPAYLPIFEARLAVEKDPLVVTSLHEAIAIPPTRIRRIVPQEAAPQHVGHRRGAHRQTGMSGVRLFDHVDGQKADRVDAQSIDLSRLH